MRIDTDHMEYFLAVVRHGTVTKAAQALHVAQPAVSRKIRALENILNITLLDRQPRMVLVTEAGKAYAEVFIQYLQAMKAVQAKFGNHNEQVIRYGMFLGWNWPKSLTSYVSAFQKEHPHIKLIGTSEDVKGLREGLVSKRLDCVVALPEMLPDYEGIRQIPLGDISRTVVYSKRNSLANRDNVTLKDFKDQPCYMFQDEVTEVAREMIMDLFKTYHLPEPEIRVVDNLESAVMALEQGEGFALLDDNQRIIHNSQFKYFILPETKTMCLAYTTESSEKSELIQFVEGIENALKV